MPSRPIVTRASLALAALVVLIGPGRAYADSAPRAETLAAASAPANAALDQPDASAGADPARSDDRLRIGGIFGVGFPRLIAVEALFKIGRYVALGAEYSHFPEFSVSGVSLTIWALAGDVRVFPLGNGFFVGLRAGHQQLDAETTLIAGNEEIPLAGGLGTVFINPRLGFLWTWDSGITLGLDAGLQIPLTSQTSGAIALADTVMVPAAAKAVSQARRVARTFGETTLPTIDLLRLGLLL